MSASVTKKEKQLPAPSISILPKDALILCMEYTGKGNYLFIASVSKEFNTCYIKAYPDYVTSPKSFASDSLECAKMCVPNKNKDFNRNVFH